VTKADNSQAGNTDGSQAGNTVIAVVALLVSVVGIIISGWGLITTRQLQGAAVLTIAGYSSDFSPKAQQAQYLITVSLRNEGPSIASDVNFGLTGLDGAALTASWQQGAIGLHETAQGRVIVNVATNMRGLTGDPTAALPVWAKYKDGLGDNVSVTFPPEPPHQAST